MFQENSEVFIRAKIIEKLKSIDMARKNKDILEEQLSKNPGSKMAQYYIDFIIKDIEQLNKEIAELNGKIISLDEINNQDN